MFNPVLAGIIAGGAFLISFVLGLFGKTALLTVLLRATAFSGCFFGIVAGIYFLYNKFLQPEETDETGAESTGPIGQNIDYSVDDDGWLKGLDAVGDGVPENISKIIGDDPEEADGVQSGAGPVGEDSFVSKGTPEVLAQSDDTGYSVNEDSLLSRKGDGGFSKDGYDMNMSAFTAGIPGIDEDSYPQRSAATSSPNPAIPVAKEGTVDMSVERRAGKADLGFDADEKKMAGAIQSLLKKDLG